MEQQSGAKAKGEEMKDSPEKNGEACPYVDTLLHQGMHDVVPHHAARGGGRGGNGRSSSSRRRAVSTVQLDTNLLSCPVCSSLLTLPVFQCNMGHLACRGCSAGHCKKCERRGKNGSFGARSAVLEYIISVAKFQCPHRGCKGLFTYGDLSKHRGDCHHAPCFCTEPGCTFTAPPHRLLRHLAGDHDWPAHGVAYGKVLGLRAPLSEPCRLLLAEDDGRLFALVLRDLGPVTAVSVVCVRAEDGEPRYMARLRTDGVPPIMTEPMTVTSSDRPGEVAVENLPGYFTVPPTHLLRRADGASKELSLKIFIKKS